MVTRHWSLSPRSWTQFFSTVWKSASLDWNDKGRDPLLYIYIDREMQIRFQGFHFIRASGAFLLNQAKLELDWKAEGRAFTLCFGTWGSSAPGVYQPIFQLQLKYRLPTVLSLRKAQRQKKEIRAQIRMKIVWLENWNRRNSWFRVDLYSSTYRRAGRGGDLHHWIRYLDTCSLLHFFFIFLEAHGDMGRVSSSHWKGIRWIFLIFLAWHCLTRGDTWLAQNL